MIRSLRARLAVLILLVAGLAPLSPPIHRAEAAACTRGVDCYCDKVQGGSLNDPLVLLCEDFEARGLYENVGLGNGAPDYGPMYDETGWGGAGGTNRGYNSYWFKRYSNGVGKCIWWGGPPGEPVSPTLGLPCTRDGQSCVGLVTWHPQNLWNGNSYMPCATVLRNGDFGAEVAAITPPTNAAGGASGVFDGVQSYGHRNPIGQYGDAGIQGRYYFGTQRTFGATMAVAYPNTIGSINLIDAWKHNEWETVLGGGGGDGLLGFGISGGGVVPTHFPFYGFMFANTGGGISQAQADAFQAACNAAIAGATITAGSFYCTGVNLGWTATTNEYTRATDWPFGTWGCLEAHYQNIGFANAAWQIWFTGPAGIRKKVIDITGFNMTWGDPDDDPVPRIQNQNGYQALNWNNYYNGNYGAGDPANYTTGVAFRYEDNLHIRAGAPVSCAQIGFGAAGGGTLGGGRSRLRL